MPDLGQFQPTGKKRHHAPVPAVQLSGVEWRLQIFKQFTKNADGDQARRRRVISDFRLLRQRESIVRLDPKVSDGAL
jgi:hypothetical protein